MNVLFIIDYKTIGGATNSFLEMVVALKRKGVRPIVCIGRITDIVDILEKEEIEYIILDHRTVLESFGVKGRLWPLVWSKYMCLFYYHEYLAIRNLRRQIDFTQIDIIHTNSARNDIGCYMNKKYGVPHIVHIREFADADFDCVSFRPRFVKYLNKNTTKFIAISDAIKKYWINKGLSEEKVTTIYNGIHFEDISVSEDVDKYNSFKMIIAGGVIPAKGQHLAIEAMALLPIDIRNKVFLDIAGWGDNSTYAQSITDYAKEKGCLNQIRFLGGVKDLHERLGKYQIGLMCSRSEGFGRTTAEYMHARLGVIASDSGANPELIEDGVTGLLFKSGDSRSLADCIIKLYNDRHMVVMLSNNAQKKARLIYSQRRNADCIFELYSELLNDK